jgi:SAM-dependent methyltransferase
LSATAFPSYRDDMGLRAAWERNAIAWAQWARAPMHDSYWRFHRDQFLTLLPPPRRLALDLGCGEGRLSRDLKTRGYRVVGIDSAPTLVRLAREADPEVDVSVTDARALPFAGETFDLVVAFMSLHDVTELPGAVREAARVLERGGRLCLAIVHPLNSAGSFESDDPASPFTIRGSYLEPFHYADEIEQDGLRMRFESEHRPLGSYFDALQTAGLLVEALREPSVPEGALRYPRSGRWQRVPLFLHVRALRP